jgi:hypothetical protein
MKNKLAVQYSHPRSGGELIEVVMTSRQYSALLVAAKAGLVRIWEVWTLGELIAN